MFALQIKLKNWRQVD